MSPLAGNGSILVGSHWVVPAEVAPELARLVAAGLVLLDEPASGQLRPLLDDLQNLARAVEAAARRAPAGPTRTGATATPAGDCRCRQGGVAGAGNRGMVPDVGSGMRAVEAAAVLGVRPRRVCQLAPQLGGVKDEDGRWWFDPEAVAAEATRRGAR